MTYYRGSEMTQHTLMPTELSWLFSLRIFMRLGKEVAMKIPTACYVSIFQKEQICPYIFKSILMRWHGYSIRDLGKDTNTKHHKNCLMKKLNVLHLQIEFSHSPLLIGCFRQHSFQNAPYKSIYC